MAAQWTSEQVIALSPDDGSTKNGRALASKRHWVTLGRNDAALWGECQGSGSKPYQTQIELSEPAFKCSCPSRKFPCKHCLGLFLLYVADAGALPSGEPPAWVADWLKGRVEKAEKKEARKNEEKSPEELAKAAAQAEKRFAARDKKVAQGLEDLELWMRDLIRQGFSTANVRDTDFWDKVAARMVDAQAPGTAKRLRDLGSIAVRETHWQGRVLEGLGALHLLLEGYKRLETLPEGTQSDIRTALGFTVRQEDVLADPNAVRVNDLWLMLGQHSYEEDNLRVRRSWMAGVNTGKFALLVHSAFPPRPLEPVPPSGMAFLATLAFYPGSSPLRAVIDPDSKGEAVTLEPLRAGFGTVADLLSAYADSLAANPWQETFPAWLQDAQPVRHDARWFIRDRDGAALPLPENYDDGWRLVALSGGVPLPAFFGEWNGRELKPLSVTTMENRLAVVG